MQRRYHGLEDVCVHLKLKVKQQHQTYTQNFLSLLLSFAKIQSYTLLYFGAIAEVALYTKRSIYLQIFRYTQAIRRNDFKVLWVIHVRIHGFKCISVRFSERRLHRLPRIFTSSARKIYFHFSYLSFSRSKHIY